MTEQTEIRKKKLQYKTTAKMWGKVLQVQGGEMLYSREEALDYLVDIGFDAWKKQNEEKQ